MDSVELYSLASASWLAIQATPLILFPSFVGILLRADSPEPGPAIGVANHALENYLSRSLGLSQLALGVMLFVLSGALPLDSMVEAPQDKANVSPYATAVVLISALYQTATGFYSYGRYYATGNLAYLGGCLGASVLAAFGLWVLLFAGEKNRRVSRRTGADKSTSGWPFKNAEADKKRF